MKQYFPVCFSRLAAHITLTRLALFPPHRSDLHQCGFLFALLNFPLWHNHLHVQVTQEKEQTTGTRTEDLLSGSSGSLQTQKKRWFFKIFRYFFRIVGKETEGITKTLPKFSDGFLFLQYLIAVVVVFIPSGPPFCIVHIFFII